ncbi:MULTISPECIES: hypothetical protein [Acidobacterium]|uniref:hypothetical protein n=1 Tax=Acidobacterium TaxID=33973 RepID=UPI00059FBAFD|nr:MULTISPECIES: hypothetical protein [Acidobacterium]HCT62079.1 hypothetical protein [Acidobacterium sp.]
MMTDEEVVRMRFPGAQVHLVAGVHTPAGGFYQIANGRAPLGNACPTELGAWASAREQTRYCKVADAAPLSGEAPTKPSAPTPNTAKLSPEEVMQLHGELASACPDRITLPIPRPLAHISEAAIDMWWKTLDVACKIEAFNLFYESFVGESDDDAEEPEQPAEGGAA